MVPKYGFWSVQEVFGTSQTEIHGNQEGHESNVFNKCGVVNKAI